MKHSQRIKLFGMQQEMQNWHFLQIIHFNWKVLELGLIALFSIIDHNDLFAAHNTHSATPRWVGPLD